MPSRNPLDPIPHPPRTPLLGNLLSLGATSPVQNMAKLARQYWPIYWLDMRGKPLVVVSGYELVNELCDESRFDKSVRGALRLVRNFAGDGLFTAYTHEPNWSKAHNILLPNFSQRAMQGYHAMMLDIAEQLVLKWERLNTDDEVDVVRDMTSLTLDTIALCGFDYRFNSFYRETNHPFVDAIGGALGGTMEQSGRLPLENLIRKDRDRKLRADIRHMNETVDRIIRERRESGEDPRAKPDLLSYMLTGVDKKTGEGLDDLNIRYQIITFLIAGHETTSGLLSFAIYALLNNPRRARPRLRRGRPRARPRPVAPTDLRAGEPAHLRVADPQGDAPALAHRARLRAGAVQGHGDRRRVPDEEELPDRGPRRGRCTATPPCGATTPRRFDPDHFTREAERARPANAYKPFGNGQRACIGRQFALQEATLVLGMILQRFALIDHDALPAQDQGEPHHQARRPHASSCKRRTSRGPRRVRAGPPRRPAARRRAHRRRAARAPGTPTPLLVLYGSNLGTAEGLARQIAEDGLAHGFAATVAPLDDYAGRLPARRAPS